MFLLIFLKLFIVSKIWLFCNIFKNTFEYDLFPKKKFLEQYFFCNNIFFFFLNKIKINISECGPGLTELIQLICTELWVLEALLIYFYLTINDILHEKLIF